MKFSNVTCITPTGSVDTHTHTHTQARHLHHTNRQRRPFSFHFMLYLAVWGVEPNLIHQTSWLESTGVCGVRQNQNGGSSV